MISTRIEVAATSRVAGAGTLPSLNTGASALLPLWLTAAEAETLVVLCAGSLAHHGEAEDDLLNKIGEILRAFRC
jgi:hypothetical protein